jgi:archaellum component FlaC
VPKLLGDDYRPFEELLPQNSSKQQQDIEEQIIATQTITADYRELC